MKEVIYTAIFLILAAVTIALIFVMFGGKDKQKDNTNQAATEAALYTPGVYTASITLSDQTFDVQVTVDTSHINAIELINLSETATVMYPLMEPTLQDIASQILPNPNHRQHHLHRQQQIHLKAPGRSHKNRPPKGNKIINSFRAQHYARSSLHHLPQAYRWKQTPHTPHASNVQGLRAPHFLGFQTRWSLQFVVRSPQFAFAGVLELLSFHKIKAVSKQTV